MPITDGPILIFKTCNLSKMLNCIIGYICELCDKEFDSVPKSQQVEITLVCLFFVPTQILTSVYPANVQEGTYF